MQGCPTRHSRGVLFLGMTLLQDAEGSAVVKWKQLGVKHKPRQLAHSHLVVLSPIRTPIWQAFVAGKSELSSWLTGQVIWNSKHGMVYRQNWRNISHFDELDPSWTIQNLESQNPGHIKLLQL